MPSFPARCTVFRHCALCHFERTGMDRTDNVHCLSLFIHSSVDNLFRDTTVLFRGFRSIIILLLSCSVVFLLPFIQSFYPCWRWFILLFIEFGIKIKGRLELCYLLLSIWFLVIIRALVVKVQEFKQLPADHSTSIFLIIDSALNNNGKIKMQRRS